MNAESPIQVVSLTEGDSPEDKVTCRLCRRQFAKYTCPTCNIPYCSLTCFRSQAHTQCSEGFYKKEIENDINSGPSKTQQQRQNMMELLRNFEEESLNQKNSQEELQGDDQEDIAERLGSLDLESTSPEELWAILTPAERVKFMKVFNDPTSELAQQLLSSEQLDKEIQDPWWQRPNVTEDDSDDLRFSYDQRTGHRYGDRPSLIHIPETMVKPLAAGRSLVYNILSICISYAYITRHLGTSPLSSLKPENADYYEARRLVTKLVPFLTDRKSTLVHPNLPAVITDFWSNFDLGTMTDNLFSLLLQDSARLLKPLLITHIEHAPTGTLHSAKAITISHPHGITLLVLSDLYNMFSNSQGHASQNEPRWKDNHICHKLLFYAAHISATPSEVLDVLVYEVDNQEQEYRSRENVAANRVVNATR